MRATDLPSLVQWLLTILVWLGLRYPLPDNSALSYLWWKTWFLVMGNGESLQDLPFDKISSFSYHPKYERVLFARRTGRVCGGYTQLTPAYVGYLFYDP